MDILILHGWNVESPKYNPLVQLLTKKGHRVVIMDMPGFGKEAPPSRPFALHDYVSFVRTIMKKNRMKRPLVIGHSFGGRVGIILAAEHPKLVGSLILTGVPGFLPESDAKVSFYYALARLGSLIFSIPVLSLCKDIARKILYKAAGATDYYRAEGIMRETFKLIIREDLVEPMKKLDLPVTIVWGSDDMTTPLWIAEKMHETIKGSKLSVIEGGRHCAIYDMPEEFVKKMIASNSKLI